MKFLYDLLHVENSLCYQSRLYIICEHFIFSCISAYRCISNPSMPVPENDCMYVTALTYLSRYMFVFFEGIA